MKVLLIGGTGNISTSVSRLAVERGIDLYLLNRGNRKPDIPNAKSIKADISKPDEARKALGDQHWDVVVNWIAFTEQDVARDVELFKGRTDQYIFISSASAYQKPPSHPVITESTPLANPFWDYSRDKIACEEHLMRAYRQFGFPVTIVRPSLTYDTVIPVALGSFEDYTIIDRMKKGQKVIVPGDGTSLWTITHSRDFAKGFVGLLGHQQTIGHAFHITSDEILTWNQIYEAVAEAAGVKANIVHIPSDFICDVADTLGQEWMRGNLLGDKAVSVIFDNSKIKTFVPDFVATIPFRQGIKETIKWFEADSSRMVIEKEANELLDTVIKRYEAK
ncbi:MAG: SDR family oxidoreductase [candidate division KSB1 bacterium]|nr:SDR family oxidoreductase [candidate division KSB1 bacterium]